MPRRAEVERAVEEIRRIASRPGPPAASLAPARGRIDVHDGRIEPFDDIREIERRDDAGWIGVVGDRLGPGRLRRAGHDGGSREAARENGADEKCDDRGENDRDEGEAARHMSAASRHQPAARRTLANRPLATGYFPL